MRLGVSDAVLLPTPVGQRVHDVAHVPVLVPLLLQQFDPHVGHGHGEAVVEPAASLRCGAAECRHARHVFRDSDLDEARYFTSQKPTLKTMFETTTSQIANL